MSIKNLYLLLALLSFLCTVSCTVEKKHTRNENTVFWKDNVSASTALLHSAAAVALPNEVVENNLVENASLGNTVYLNPAQQNSIYPEPASCDSLILVNGTKLNIRILAISSTYIKFRSCKDASAPISTVKKIRVHAVKYENGNREILNPIKLRYIPAPKVAPVATTKKVEKSVNKTDQIKSTPKKPLPLRTTKTNPFAVLSLFSLMLMVIIPILLPILAYEFAPLLVIFALLSLLFGIISLIQFKNNPGKYEGKGLAILSIAVSVFILSLVALLFLSL